MGWIHIQAVNGASKRQTLDPYSRLLVGERQRLRESEKLTVRYIQAGINGCTYAGKYVFLDMFPSKIIELSKL